MTPNQPLAPLAFAVLLALAGPAAAVLHEDMDGGHRHDHERDEDGVRTLDALEVTATPLGTAVDALVRPVEVLADEELDARRAGTLGETVSRLPGVQSSFFGPGVEIGRASCRGGV